jgi:hypothetical protein
MWATSVASLALREKEVREKVNAVAPRFAAIYRQSEKGKARPRAWPPR